MPSPSRSPLREVAAAAPPRPTFARRLVALVAVGALVALGGVGAARAAPLRIGVGPRIAAAPLVVAAAQGFFEREGVDAVLDTVAPGEDVVGRLADGTLDLVTLSADALLRADELGGVDLRGAYVLGIAGASDAILAREDVRDTRRLRGRRVAFEPGSAGELLLREALQRKGRRLQDIEAVALTGHEAAAALLAGDVDAAVLHGPELAAFVDAAGFRTLATAEDPAGLVSDLLVGTDAALAADKARITGVIRAIDAAVAWMRRRPDEALGLVAEAWGVAPAAAALALAGTELLGVEDDMTLLRGEYQVAFSSMSEVLDVSDDGRPREVPSANRYLSLSALRQVAAGR